jgi:hypothetical protein
MGFGDIQRARYDINVITTQYYLTAKIEPYGPFVLWLNDMSRVAVPLYSVNGVALDAGRSLDTFQREDLLVLKQDIVAVDLLSADARETVTLMQRSEKMVLFTDRFVFNGNYPMSAETRVPEMLDTLKGEFFPITAVQAHPLRAVRATIFRTSDMTILNRRFITAYHSMA